MKQRSRTRFAADSFHYPRDHPEAKAFVQHIEDHPDDTTSRLVYSDWLDEHGHGEHADAVRQDVQNPIKRYYSDGAADDAARRGVMLTQSGLEPIRGWKSEDIFFSDNLEEQEPETASILEQHGVGPELLDHIVGNWHMGGHSINMNHQDLSGPHRVYNDEEHGYQLVHHPYSGYLSLGRKLA